MAEPIETLRERIEALESEIRTLADKDEITADEDARLDEALTERESALAEFERLEAREARLAAFRETPTPSVRTADAPYVNTRTADPFDVSELRDASPDKRSSEMRAPPRSIVEESRGGYGINDASAEKLTKQLGGRDRVSRDVAELVLATGSEEYRDLFERAIADPSSVTVRVEMEKRYQELYSRAAIQTAGVSGALHLPYQLDPTLVLTDSGVADPIRQVSRVVSISGTDKWESAATAGITAALVGESVQFTDNTPTFTSTQIATYKAGAFAFGSYEALADSGAAEELAYLFGEAKTNLEASYFATGTGSSQPQGVVVFASNATSVVAGSSGAANAADLVAADIYALRAAVPPRFRGNAVWMGSLDVAHDIRQLGTTNNFHAFSLDLTQADPPTLLGRPFYENSSMDTTIVSGSTDFVLVHGDFSKFVVVDRVGATLLYQPIITSGSKFPTGESGWHLWWRFGSGGIAQNAFRMLKL